MRVEIEVSENAPRHLRETLGRAGFEVLRVGTGWRVRIGGVWVSPAHARVRLDPDGRVSEDRVAARTPGLMPGALVGTDLRAEELTPGC